MVLIAAAVVTKGGKCLLARQFVTEMTKSRLEGLLEAFPKLIGTNSSQRQHTFVETDSVRYVYQPIDEIYVVLITTKKSNILEDLEALRLFSRVIPEYCRSNDEAEILNKAFDLIFAFDEIVALGYRENVNLAMIRTYTEMDSHEERVHKQILNAQMREAISKGQQRAKELKLKKHDHDKRLPMSSATAISSSSSSFVSVDRSLPSVTEPAPSRIAPSIGGKSKALKLGAKNVSDEAFVEKLRNEGQVVSDMKKLQVSSKPAPEESLNREAVLVKLTEKLTASVSRNGGVESAEILGSLSVNINDDKFITSALRVGTHPEKGKACQMQVHPNMDKNPWKSNHVLKLKSADKTYPLNTDVGLLKWRMNIDDEEELPLTLNVFPNENADGCVVNIEYNLKDADLSLKEVVVTIPLPPATQPTVTDVVGNYEYIRSKSLLKWTIPLIDGKSDVGTLEFSVPNGHSDHFFPVHVDFWSDKLLSGLYVNSALDYDCSSEVNFTANSHVTVEKYEII
ncbi:hypothetical protein FO519_004855 [Halicephalobus sp. NKZ332]|nr:hypothetical protein FO519_004855 [Halicephalobus sp. NKZ332]